MQQRLEWINDQLTVLAEAFGEPLTEQRLEIYCSGLADIPQIRLSTAFRRACYELKWFPKLAELRELAGALPDGANDGRPGVEEAWARMPKGDRIEDDTVVWCEEERIAYEACRPLLLDGDVIGARMAFKERYQRALAEARAENRPVRWTVSTGYDVEHRIATLATAVQQKRIAAEHAMTFVPFHRADDFARMLPAGEAKGLLTGTVERPLNLPGFAGLLARMQMEGTLPENLKPRARVQQAPERSPEEMKARREVLARQAEQIKRSRRTA